MKFSREPHKGPFVPEVNTVMPRPRPPITSTGVTEKIKSATVIFMSVSMLKRKGFARSLPNTDRAGGCYSQSEATARFISISSRSRISVDAISRVIKKYNDIGANGNGNGNGYANRNGYGTVETPKIMATTLMTKAEKAVMKKARVGVAVDNACPECGNAINHESGCVVCTHCGYSKRG